jgi:hypothetical protein
MMHEYNDVTCRTHTCTTCKNVNNGVNDMPCMDCRHGMCYYKFEVEEVLTQRLREENGEDE